ncbi:MAG: hypothetical protein CMJ24_03740 [Phycisphaerae bacterium]|mgnify:CR=1 FL=1|nr:hypothetical protein [Phycisphaerae bacterium]
MSGVDPMMRFIGVASDADPFVLLGLDPDRLSGPAVDAALVSRLARIYGHPDGRSDMAEDVRTRLRDAAAELKDPQRVAELASRIHVAPAVEAKPELRPAAPSRSAAKQAELTPLQIQLMQVLASCGGWNAMSRARLASIGAMHGLSPAEMVEQLQSLTDIARDGFVSLPSIRSGPSGAASARALEPGFVERVVDQYAPELRSSDRKSLVKLCLLFGGLGLLALLLMLRVLISGINPDAAATGTSAGRLDANAAGVAASDAPGGLAGDDVPLATFTTSLVLPLKPLAREILDEVDASSNAIRSLDALARHAIGIDEMDERLELEWNAAIEVGSTGWFAADPATARSMRKAVTGVLQVAGSNPRLVGPLLIAISPAAPGSTADPLDIPRGAWRCGMIGSLVGADAMSPVVRSIATEHVRDALGRQAVLGTFQSGAVDWLSASIPGLVEGLDVRTSARRSWKLWFRCLNAVSEGKQRDAVLLEAAELLLRTQSDLSRPELPQMVLGRLLVEMDWGGSPLVRDRVLGWFAEPDIGSTDLWVLTSTLVTIEQASWYGRNMVVPSDADMPLRRRIRTRVASKWPTQSTSMMLAGRGVPEGFDPKLADTWLLLLESVRSIDRGRGSLPMLHRLVMERLLVEAADELVNGQGVDTLSILNRLEQMIEDLDRIEGRSAASANRGSPLAGRIDGQWARLYEIRGRSRADKIDMFRELELQSGDDLGPIDADLLASEAMSSSLGVREAAQYLIETRFSLGPNVAQALVDNIPEASKTADVTGLIESVSGEELPRPTSANWPIEARLALVNHAMALRLDESGEIDAYSDSLSRSLRRQSQRLGRSVREEATPEESARALVAAWEDRLEAVRDSSEWAWAGAWRDRRTARHLLASDSLQAYLIEQIALEELLAHWFARLQPDSASLIDELQSELIIRRDRAVHVLEQMLVTEAAVVELWSMRIRHLIEMLEQIDGGGGA